MLMTQSLTPSQCATMREFFSLLLKAKQLDIDHKGINVGKVLEAWNIEKFGRSKYSMNNVKQKSHRWLSAGWERRFDNRREWLANNPNGTPEEAAEAWGIKVNVANMWLRNARKRQGRMN